MSANIPFEIQVEIINRLLPVKSLIRFRSVSKQWKSLIDSSQFIAHHSVHQTQPHHLLVTYNVLSERKYVSIADDDSFPEHKSYPLVTTPPLNLPTNARMIGSSHGLVCLHGVYQDERLNRNHLIVVWNPSIRKSVGVVVPPPAFFDTFGFGVCPKTNDPKIVKITHLSAVNSWKTDIFTLSSGAWRSKSMNPTRKSTRYTYNQVVIDGVIHWGSYDSDVIMTFDLTSEEFGELNLPDALPHPRGVSISKLNDSLVLLRYEKDDRACDVWMMIKNKNGDRSAFAKLFTFNFKALDGWVFYHVIGFRKNGQPISERVCRGENSLVTTLEVYEPYTQRSSDLGLATTYGWFYTMASYTESLLLLNCSDSIIY